MKKILIIEDHADMRELLTWQIELMGFVPIPARRGKEGVEKALAEKPQLIIMDIMMPGMDGWEAARELRANAETKDIPILAATALFRDCRSQDLSRSRMQRLHRQAIHFSGAARKSAGADPRGEHDLSALTEELSYVSHNRL